MSTKSTAPTIVARLTTAALTSVNDAHARQRDLVRASLLAR